MIWLDCLKIKKQFEVKKISKINKTLKIEKFISSNTDHYLELNFQIFTNMDLSEFIENLTSFIRKVYLMNTHLNFSLIYKNETNFEIIIQLDSNTLAIPFINNIKQYLEVEYDIDPNNILSFEEYFDEIKIETIFIFTENKIKINYNLLEIVVYEDREYDENLNKLLIKDLTNNTKFNEILKNNFIKIKKLDNVYTIKIVM
jgi:hypothetical protein